MSYSVGHPVRLIAGRIALDFVNTADWSADGAVVHEKIESPADVAAWLAALNLPEVAAPESVSDVRAFRFRVREAIRGAGPLERSFDRSVVSLSEAGAQSQTLFDLVTVSAAAMLSDPREMARLKTCPGVDCGWMFIDETRNGRRKWCTMETCGNRAKAARHYKRAREASSSKAG